MDFFLSDAQGRIIQTGNCPASQMHLQNRRGVTLRMGRATIDGHYWDKTKGLMPIPARPSAAHEFSYDAKAWVLDEARAWELVRQERDRLLALTDWRVARATESGAPLAQDWKQYRQALRDVTQQADPLAIDWPIEPRT